MSNLHEDDICLFEGIVAVILDCIGHCNLIKVRVKPSASLPQGGYVSFCPETQNLSIVIRERDKKNIWHTNARSPESILKDVGFFLHRLNKGKSSQYKITKFLLSSWKWVESNPSLLENEDVI